MMGDDILTALRIGQRRALGGRALLLGDRLDLRSLETTRVLARSPLTIPAGERGVVVLFRYGAAVLFDLTPLEEVEFVRQIEPLIRDPFGEPELEQAAVAVDPDREEGIDESGKIVVHEATIPRLQLLGDILGKSVVLARYEKAVAAQFDQIEPLAKALQEKGSGVATGKNLLQQIGAALLIEQKTVGRVEVTEKPELLWERPELERFYARLEDEYELHERQLALDRKLALISRTAQTLLDLLHTQRSLRVEWYITLLIIFEVLLTLYEMFVRG